MWQLRGRQTQQQQGVTAATPASTAVPPGLRSVKLAPPASTAATRAPLNVTVAQLANTAAATRLTVLIAWLASTASRALLSVAAATPASTAAKRVPLNVRVAWPANTAATRATCPWRCRPSPCTGRSVASAAASPACSPWLNFQRCLLAGVIRFTTGTKPSSLHSYFVSKCRTPAISHRRQNRLWALKFVVMDSLMIVCPFLPACLPPPLCAEVICARAPPR